MIDGNKLGEVGFEKIGTPYSVMDCQKFVEWCISQCGINIDLRGSNAWYRYVIEHGWVGSPEDCKKKFGCIPKGAFLFIHKFDGGEESRGYKDGLGNATHIGICTMPKGEGAINSSSSKGCVCESKFQGKTIKNGGWNKVGLWLEKVEYEGINNKSDDPPQEDEPDTPEAWVYVYADNGKPVKMRAKPSSNCRTYWEVPVGSQVMLEEAGKEWSKITWAGRTGWMMSKFLRAEMQTYTVISKGLTKDQAEKLVREYGGTMTAE